MSIGIGQIIVTLLVLLLVFGNLPKITKDIIYFVKELKKSFNSKEQSKIENNSDKNGPSN